MENKKKPIKYIIELKLEQDNFGTCYGCIFEHEENCPNDKCGSDKIFRMKSFRRFRENER